MERKPMRTGIAAALGILLLILDGKTALSGAKEGLSICIRSVIPSLFPFFVLGILLTGNLWGCRIPILRPMGKLFGIPAGAESLLLTSFLGGYPIGAQSIANAWRQGHIQREEAEKLLGFCNNAGPSFIFGIIGPLFLDGYIPWLLWGVHIFSAWVVAKTIPLELRKIPLDANKRTSLPAALQQSIPIMAGVCGWIVLFRISIAFLNRWVLWLLPPVGQTAIAGMLELVNGCCSLASVPEDSYRLILCSGFLGFGGVCVSMQTASVTEGLRLTYYFPGKVMQGAVSMVISWMIFPNSYLFPVILCPIIAISAISLRKLENRSRNPLTIGV